MNAQVASRQHAPQAASPTGGGLQVAQVELPGRRSQNVLTRAAVTVLQGAVLLTTLSGCGDAATPVVPADAAADFDHDHSHPHSGGIGHEHDHGDFEGDHSHGHSHAHRHAEPTRGGRIVSVGHTHHDAGVDVFHAEVLPLSGGRLVLEVLVEEDGHMRPANVPEDSFEAIVGPTDGDDGLARTITFKRQEDSLFSADAPEDLTGDAAMTVVVPRIELGGERLNFSYTVHGQAAAASPGGGDASTAEEPS